jgi:hypothetical protein
LTSATAATPTSSDSTKGGNTGGIVDRVRERAAAQLSSQKDKATDGLGTVASAVRQTTQSLRDQQHETVAHYVEQAADQIERLSERLKNKDVRELLDDVQQLARRQPALFIGGAFALGLMGARFLKSSADRSSGNRYDRDSSAYGAGTTDYGGGTRYGGGGAAAYNTGTTGGSYGTTSGAYGSRTGSTSGTSRDPYGSTTPGVGSSTDRGTEGY